jgi:hypothetical protein
MTAEIPWRSEDLPIPIYLDQRSVFDLLAVLRDGFSVISNVMTSTAASEESAGVVEGSIGISNPFALLGIQFGASGKLNSTKNSADGTQVSTQRVHTPTSLFAQLRMDLHDIGLCADLDQGKNIRDIKHNDFVEFSAVLERSPIVNALEAMQALIRVRDEVTAVERKIETGQKPGGAHHRPNKPAQREEPEAVQVRALLDMLRDPQGTDYIGKIEGIEGATAVVYTRTAYFTDENVRQLNDARYRVLGKVIRIVESGEEEINLLRNSAFGAVEVSKLKELSTMLDSIRQEGLGVSEIIATVRGPVLLVRPIAISA